MPAACAEMDRCAKCIVEMKDNQTVLTPPPDAAEKGAKGASKDTGQKVFAFDRSYWSFDKNAPNYAGQQTLHDDLGKPLLDNAFQGFNNTVLAYGQTGSGKSFSVCSISSTKRVCLNGRDLNSLSFHSTRC